MVFHLYPYQQPTNMGSLWKILNNDEPSDDVTSLQQKHSGFVFSVPEPQSPVDSSDIAIQTLHALADLHNIKKERTYDNLSTPSPSNLKSEPKWEHYANNNNNNNNSNSNTNNITNNNNINNNNNNNLSNCSRRDYKKKQLVIRPELMQMKQAKAAVKLGIPPSTFSKRWRESLPDRKWPYRVHKKVEKSIQMLKVLQNKGHDVTGDLKRLMTQRELNLKPAIITMFEDVNENFELDTTTPATTSTTDSPSSSSSTTSTPLASSSPPESPLSPSSPAAQVPLGASDEVESASGEELEMNDDDSYNVHSPVSVPKRRKLSKSDDEN